jgi:hypothetical protein
MTGFCDHGDELSGSIITEIVDRWNNYRLIIQLEDGPLSILLSMVITELCVQTLGPED